jgi:hypothetical protein
MCWSSPTAASRLVRMPFDAQHQGSIPIDSQPQAHLSIASLFAVIEVLKTGKSIGSVRFQAFVMSILSKHRQAQSERKENLPIKEVIRRSLLQVTWP